MLSKKKNYKRKKSIKGGAMESYRNQLNRFNEQLKSFTKIPKGDLLEWQKTRINKIKENIERIEGLIKAAKRKSSAKAGAPAKRKSPPKAGAPAKKSPPKIGAPARKSSAKTRAATKRKSPDKAGAANIKFRIPSPSEQPSEQTLKYIRTVLKGPYPRAMDNFLNWRTTFKEKDIKHAIEKYNGLKLKQKEEINIFIKKTFKEIWRHSTDDGGMIFYNTSSETLHETLAHEYLK